MVIVLFWVNALFAIWFAFALIGLLVNLLYQLTAKLFKCLSLVFFGILIHPLLVFITKK